MPASLETYKESIVYKWEGDEVLPIILNNQAAMRALLRRQTRLIRQRREVIYDLAFHPVANRLAKVLLERFGPPEVACVERDLTLEEMASMIASSPEVVCRVLYQFQSKGLLKITRANITLENREALVGLVAAEGDE
jgi:CRP-like cAMP-binding protein